MFACSVSCRVKHQSPVGAGGSISAAPTLNQTPHCLEGNHQYSIIMDIECPLCFQTQRYAADDGLRCESDHIFCSREVRLTWKSVRLYPGIPYRLACWSHDVSGGFLTRRESFVVRVINRRLQSQKRRGFLEYRGRKGFAPSNISAFW